MNYKTYTIAVDVTTIEDSLQMREFGRFITYFIFLLETIPNFSKINVFRYSVNSTPELCFSTDNVMDFENWLGRFVRN